MSLVDRLADQIGKAFATSSLPGLTRKLTGTVKIYENPHVYVYDTPGVMVPYLGKGEEGAERGLKLALTGEYCCSQIG
jgi:ribosome biogenesis GTPase A